MSFVEEAKINGEKTIKVDFRDKLFNLMEECNITFEEAYELMKEFYINDVNSKIKESIKENEKYLGKYFKIPTHIHCSDNKYLKVISATSVNVYNVECLFFDEHPTYWFDYQNSKSGTTGDYCLGAFDFDSVTVKSFHIKDLEQFQEITKEEFDNALRNYIEELIELEWKVN